MKKELQQIHKTLYEEIGNQDNIIDYMHIISNIIKNNFEFKLKTYILITATYNLYITNGMDIYRTDTTFSKFHKLNNRKNSWEEYDDFDLGYFGNIFSDIETLTFNFFKEEVQEKHYFYSSGDLDFVTLENVSSLKFQYNYAIGSILTSKYQPQYIEQPFLLSSPEDCDNYSPVSDGDTLYTFIQKYGKNIPDDKVITEINDYIIPAINTNFTLAVNQIMAVPDTNKNADFYWTVAKSTQDNSPIRWDEDITLKYGDKSLGNITTWKIKKIPESFGFTYPQSSDEFVLTGLPVCIESNDGKQVLSTSTNNAGLISKCQGIDEVWLVWLSDKPLQQMTDGTQVLLQKGLIPTKEKARTLGNRAGEFIKSDFTLANPDVGGVFGIGNFINVSKLAESTWQNVKAGAGDIVRVQTIAYVMSSLIFKPPSTNLNIPEDGPSSFDCIYKTDNDIIVTFDFLTEAFGIKKPYRNQQLRMSLTTDQIAEIDGLFQNFQYCLNSDNTKANIKFQIQSLGIQLDDTNQTCKTKPNNTLPCIGGGGQCPPVDPIKTCTVWNYNDDDCKSFLNLTFGKGPKMLSEKVGPMILSQLNQKLNSTNTVTTEIITVDLPSSSS